LNVRTRESLPRDLGAILGAILGVVGGGGRWTAALSATRPLSPLFSRDPATSISPGSKTV
jgi:hypothetical protein